MKSLNIITFLASLFLLIACSDPETNSPLPENTGKEFKKDTLISKTAQFVSDTAVETFRAEKGELYIVEVSDDVSDELNSARIVGMYDPAGNLMVSENSNWGYHNTEGFKAQESGDYRIEIVNNGTSGERTYKFKLLTMEYPEELNGTWVLVQGEAKAFGHTQTFNYTTNSTLNYWSHKDGIITYVPWWYLEGRSIVSAFPNSWISKFKYRIEEDLFILTAENEHCSSQGIFKKYEGDVNDIKWVYDEPFDNRSFRGRWYLAHEKRKKITDSTEFESYEKSYSKPGTSPKMIEIDSASVYEISYDGFSIDTTTIGDAKYWPHQYYRIENNSMTYYRVQAGFDEGIRGVEGDGWRAFVDSLVYKRYEDEGFPEEWVTAP